MNKKNVVPSIRILKISQDKGYACVYLNGEQICSVPGSEPLKPMKHSGNSKLRCSPVPPSRFLNHNRLQSIFL